MRTSMIRKLLFFVVLAGLIFLGLFLIMNNPISRESAQSPYKESKGFKQAAADPLLPNQINLNENIARPPVVLTPQVTNVNISVIYTGNTLYLSWDNVSGASQYRIYRSLIKGFGATPMDYLKSVSVNYTYDTGLTDNLTYYYRIASVFCDGVEGQLSNEANGTPQDTTPPSKVTGLTINVIPTGNSLSLSWNASPAPDFAAYRVYRSMISSGPYFNIANRTTNSYTDTGLVDEIRYYYVIRAVDEVPNVGPSSDESSGVPQDITPPPKVTGVIITIIYPNHAINLTWTASTAPDIAGYRIYRSTTPGFTPCLANNIANVTTNSYLDTGLIDGVTYYYRIRAYDEVPNLGTASDEPNSIIEPMPPTKVTGVMITIIPSGNKLNITWTKSMAPDVVNYRVYRSTTPGFTPSPANPVASPLSNYYLDSGLTDGVTYYYRISAVDEVPNEGALSDQASGTPQDTTPPPKVTGVTINIIPTGNSISLSWTASSAPDFVAYRVYRSMISGGPYFSIANRTTNSYTDTGLIDGTRYYYVIRAVDEVPNVGPPSDESNGVPQDTTAPPTLTGGFITVISEGNQLNITWNPSPAPDLVNYRVYRSTTPGFTPGPANLIATPTVNYYVDSGLSNGVQYYYKISAVDEVPNESPPMAIIVAILEPDPPPQVTGVMITVIPTGNQLNITWTKSPAPDVVGYKIYRSTTPGFVPGPVYFRGIATVNYYIDMCLCDGVTYYYRISAFDEVPNEGTYSDHVSGTPQDTTSPPQVTGLIITALPIGNALFMTWTASSAPDINYYKIYRSNFSSIGSFQLIATPTSNSYTDFGLHDKQLYYYKISAVDDGGPTLNEGTPSDPTNGTPHDSAAPPIITGFEVMPHSEGLSLSWDACPTPDFKAYRVYRSITSKFTPNLANLVATPATNYYADTNITGGRSYYYCVSAIDEVSNEGAPAYFGAYPDNPSYCEGWYSLIPSKGRMNFVFWERNQTYSITASITFYTGGYDRFWGNISKINSSFEINVKIWKWLGPVTQDIETYTHTYELGHLENGDYTLLFKAWDTPVENVSFLLFNSNIFAPPVKISGIHVMNEGTGDMLNISWSFTPEANVDHFNIYRSSDANFSVSPGVFIAFTSNNFYQDRGLIEYQTYYYRIAGVDENNNEGPPSDSYSGIPLDIKPPGAPTIDGFLSYRDVIIIVNSPLDNDVCFFKLYRSQQSGGPYEFLGIYDPIANPIIIVVQNEWDDNLEHMPIIITGDPNTTQLPNLSLNYYYIVTAVDEKYQESLPSNEIYLGLPPLSPPRCVNIIDNGNGDLQITWENNPNNSLSLVSGYRIYRKNTLETNPILIATISGVNINSYIDYGIQNGNWTYFITSLDIYGRESPFSEPYHVRISDILPPGPPSNLRYELSGSNLTLIWDPPIASNYGADISCYRIYILTKNSNNFTELMLCGTVFGRLNTRFCLNSPDRSLYYFSVVAYDENNYGSAPANITLSLAHCVPWILPIIEISDNQQIDIYIRLQNYSWINQIQMKYSLNGGISHIIDMTCTDLFSNQTLVLKGIITSQAPGTVINFTFVISDGWSNSVVTPYYLFRVPSEKIDPSPWPIGILIFFIIGAICAASLYTISSVRKYRTEREIKSLLEKVIKSPITPNFVDPDVLQENKSLECERENRAQQPIELVEIEPPPYEMQNWEQQSPELIEKESIKYEEQKTGLNVDQLNENDAFNNKSLHPFTDQFEEFKPVLLFKIFYAFLKAFPLLRHAFAEENKIMYILELNSLSREEQFTFFKNLITRNSEIEIRLQLNNLMVELNNADLQDPWDELLPKLNTCIDLAQIIDDREFLTDVFLLTVLIQSSFG